MQLANKGLQKAAYYLTLIGGVIMVLLGILEFVGMPFKMPMSSPLRGMTFGFGVLLGVVLGIVAIAGAKHASQLVWAIILIIIGIVGGGFGGLLVLLGGIMGLIYKYA
jgi:hypothetical protein